MLDRRRVNRIAVGLLGLVAVAGVVLWPELPRRMAIQWGVSGSPNTYVSKPLAVFGPPAVGAAAVALTRLMPGSMTNTPGGENVTVLFVAGVIAVLQAYVFAWNLGVRVDAWVVVAPVVAAAAALVWYAATRQ